MLVEFSQGFLTLLRCAFVRCAFVRAVLVVCLILAACEVTGFNSLAPICMAQTSMLETPSPTALPTTPPESVRKAYMNCLLEVDRLDQELIANQKARDEESRTQLKFCENRKKECSLNKDGAECRTFVEEFASE